MAKCKPRIDPAHVPKYPNAAARRNAYRRAVAAAKQTPLPVTEQRRRAAVRGRL